MTVKLYEEDSELLDFTATVLACEAGREGFQIELDRTAFFPEGGGQGADHGTLGDAHITDCHETDGRIVHTADIALSVGECVQGHVDALRRLSMMQQHSGEHIFSGLVHRRFGYHNVGFHIGSDAVTMDFDGRMTLEDALEIELQVNQAIWKDLPVKAWYPSPEELARIDYRSKKALDGAVRIVEIEGYDTCACCGTHVSHTGQIGQVKVIAFQNYKSGVRVSILCGMRALAYENEVFRENRDVSHLTSAKSGELAQSVARLMEERDELKQTLVQVSDQLFDSMIASAPEDVAVLRSDFLPVAQLRPCCGKLAGHSRIALLLSRRPDGWNYALSAHPGHLADVRPLSKELQSVFAGKGGGTKDMVQGVLSEGTEETILAWLSSWARAHA